MSERKNCQGNCKNEDGGKCVPFFEVQDDRMHYNWVNRRSMISLIAVCITMIIIVIVFTTNQTKREQMWQETIKSMYSATAAEVEHGQQDPDH